MNEEIIMVVHPKDAALFNAKLGKEDSMSQTETEVTRRETEETTRRTEQEPETTEAEVETTEVESEDEGNS